MVDTVEMQPKEEEGALWNRTRGRLRAP